jgi:hypothetical protein
VKRSHRHYRRSSVQLILESVADHIRENWIRTEKLAVRETGQARAKTAYPSPSVEGMNCEHFTASVCSVDGFLSRQSFSLRAHHPEGRTSIEREYSSDFLDWLSQGNSDWPGTHF